VARAIIPSVVIVAVCMDMSDFFCLCAIKICGMRA